VVRNVLSPQFLGKFAGNVLSYSVYKEKNRQTNGSRNMTKCKREICRIMWKTLHDVNHEHQRHTKNSIALSSEEDQATSTGNMNRKFREVWTRLRYASGQTVTQTRWSQDFAPVPGDEVIKLPTYINDLQYQAPSLLSLYCTTFTITQSQPQRRRLTCAQKLTYSKLNLPHGTTTKKTNEEN